jgi:branched-chain amino acid transport system ATP-binding protein
MLSIVPEVASNTATVPALEVRGLVAGYGDFRALHGIDLSVAAGSAVSIIGANGAGKSTLLTCVMGGLGVPNDAVRLFGEPVGGLGPRALFQRGVAIVPEGRKLFQSLTLAENLVFGELMAKRKTPSRLDFVYELFPALAGRRGHYPAQLSGGQQQMVAIGRALMSSPRLLLCDELSLGLSPQATEEIYVGLARVRKETSLILVEQSLQVSLANSDQFYCLVEGRVALRGFSANASIAAVRDAYFGVTGKAIVEMAGASHG